MNREAKNCPSCSQQIASDATVCPKCGHRFPRVDLGLLLIFLAVILFGLFPFSPNPFSALFLIASVILGLYGFYKILKS